MLLGAQTVTNESNLSINAAYQIGLFLRQKIVQPMKQRDTDRTHIFSLDPRTKTNHLIFQWRTKSSSFCGQDGQGTLQN